jgi:DNA-binding transcriptional ArsR family regulator
MKPTPPAGEDLLRKLGALASAHRLRVLAALKGRRVYVSQLARDVGLSRPLLQMHLAKLEAAGLVSAQLELSEDGKAVKYYQLSFAELVITPEIVAAAAATLPSTDAD